MAASIALTRLEVVLRMSAMLLGFLLAAGCVQRVTSNPESRRDDVNLVVQMDSLTGGGFPLISDSSRILPDGSIRADSNAPPCAVAPIARDSDWRDAETPIKSSYLRGVALRLPADFAPSWYSHPGKEKEEEGVSNPYWGHLLGSWDTMDRDGPLESTSSFAVWIGPDEGYPTVGIGGDKVVQVSYRECRVTTATEVLPVALFVVRSPSPTLGGYYLATYWEIQPGVYVQALGSGPDSTSQETLLTAIATIHVLR